MQALSQLSYTPDTHKKQAFHATQMRRNEIMQDFWLFRKSFLSIIH